MKKRSALGGIALLAVGLLIGTIRVYSRDIPAPDVSDLRIERATIAPEDNAATFFFAATNFLQEPVTQDVYGYLDGTYSNTVTVESLLLSNQQAFTQITLGVSHDICLAPEVKSFEQLLPHLSPWRELGRLLALDACHARLQGRYADAGTSAATLVRFGALVHRDAECLIQYLVGVSIEEMGLQQCRALAHDTNTPVTVYTVLENALTSRRPATRGLVKAIKAEHRAVAGLLERVARGDLSMADMSEAGGLPAGGQPLKGLRMPQFLFHRNRTTRDMVAVYRSAITNAPKPYAEQHLISVDDVLGINTTRRSSLLFKRNPLGKALIAMILPATDTMLLARCRHDTSVAATELLLHLATYRRQTGALPASLDELVGHGLTAIPIDPFDGQPFRYSREAAVVYSVGMDLQDSQGSAELPPGFTDGDTEQRRKSARDLVYGITQPVAFVAAD